MSDQPSYLGAMFTSTSNMVVVGVAMAAAGVLTVGAGLAIGAIPLVLLAGGEALAAMVVPNLPSFRNKVSREWRSAKRSRTRAAAIAEISSRTGFRLANDGYSLTGGRERGDDGRSAAAYNDMVGRIRSLSNVAGDQHTRLGQAEVERLHEAALDFLSMWLARLIIVQRASSVDLDELRAKVSELSGQIETAKRGGDAIQVRTLERARNEYAGLIRSHQSLGPRREALEAAMVAMPDKINEIQQMVMAAPYASGMDTRLEDSLSRLRIAEEVAEQIQSELYDELPSMDFSAIVRETAPATTPIKAAPQPTPQAKARKAAASTR